MRRLALLVLKDKQGKFLLQHRTKDAPTHPDMWGFFGGHIEEDEEPEKAAEREIEEELGIQVADLSFFKRYDFSDTNRDIFIFHGSLDVPLEKLEKQQKEGQGMGLFSVEEMKNLNIVYYIPEILNDFFERSLIDKT